MRDNKNRLIITKFDRWVGSLKEDIKWNILEKDGRTVRLVRTSGFTEPIQGTDYSGKVATMSRTLEMLSQDIAEIVKTLSGTKASK